jgi:signal transduction histidine kinase
VDINENRVKAAVEDEGRGFEPGEEANRNSGTGLASMKERATLLGGSIDLVSALDQGTRIEIFLPLLPRSRR